MKKFGLLAILANIVNAHHFNKRDPYWIKMSDVIQKVRPDFYFGVATTRSSFKNPRYGDIVSTFNLQVAENECKFYTIQGSENFNTEQCDESIAYAKEFGAVYRGHNLFWPANSPFWFKQQFDNSDINITKSVILDYVAKVLDHYKNEESILYWDVVNEALTDDSTIENIVIRTGSDSSNEFAKWNTYTEDIFKIAREHTNPNVKLFYNDYDIENSNGDFNNKTGAAYKYIKSLKEKKVPIDGIGLQMHIKCDIYPNYDQLYSLISKYEELGVEVHITEMDISMEKCKSEEEQRKLYLDVFKACFDHSNCKVFTVWGAYDTKSWLGANNFPLLFDDEMYPKDVYFDMLDYVLKKLPSDATYPTPTSTVKPTIDTSDGINYIIRPNTYIIDKSWANWSWAYENVDFDKDGFIYICPIGPFYGALSFHTDNEKNEFNEGAFHFKMKVDRPGQVKVVIHCKNQEFYPIETYDDIEVETVKDYVAKVPLMEDDTCNRISFQDAYGTGMVISVNDLYFTDKIDEEETPIETIATSTEAIATTTTSEKTTKTPSTSTFKQIPDDELNNENNGVNTIDRKSVV